MNFDFLKDRYDCELDRRDKSTAALALPSGVVTAFGGLIAVMARSFSYERHGLTLVFLLVTTCDLAVFIVCLWHLAFAYHGQSYELLPKLGDLVASEREWLDWASRVGDEELLRNGFNQELQDRMVSAADHNADSNDRRQAYLHRANIALITVLILTALSGIPYVVDQAMIRAMPRPQQSGERPAPQQPQAQVPPRPSIPPNRVIREGQMPEGSQTR